MNLRLSVTSPLTSLRLKDLGVKFKAAYYWKCIGRQYDLVPCQNTFITSKIIFIPAFNIAELGQIIPWGFFQAGQIHKMPGGIWQVELSDKRLHSYSLEVEARAAYLVDLISSRQIDLDEINHPEKYEMTTPSGVVYPLKKQN